MFQFDYARSPLTQRHDDRDPDRATPPHLPSSSWFSLSHQAACAHASTLSHPVVAQSALTQVTNLLAFITDLDSTSSVAAQTQVSLIILDCGLGLSGRLPAMGFMAPGVSTDLQQGFSRSQIETHTYPLAAHSQFRIMPPAVLHPANEHDHVFVHFSGCYCNWHTRNNPLDPPHHEFEWQPSLNI